MTNHRGKPEIIIARATVRHALGWLVAANLVGVVLALLLLCPGLNATIAPLTYGRWIPLHLDWQLYGWCALPLVGALCSWCLDERHPDIVSHAQTCLWLWTGALALAGVGWLGGSSSGKMFLEWSGVSRPLLPMAMSVLWSVLAAHTWWRSGRLAVAALRRRILVLFLLLFVPVGLYLSSSRSVYPRVNPDSGGATGARLLASTLGIVGIYGLLAELTSVAKRKMRRAYWGYFLFSVAVFGLTESRNASHHSVGQILGLGTLLGWIPLVWYYFEARALSPTARPWWIAAFVWWILLLVSGFWTFLPGISERMKFTNGMVGHAHLAMAGLVTSANLAILTELGGLPRLRWFWAWQVSLVLHVATLLSLGWLEVDHQADFFLGGGWVQGLYTVRLATGLAMAAVSVLWFRAALRPIPPALPQ